MDYECWLLGDSALLLRFGGADVRSANAKVHSAAASLAAARLTGVLAIAPSYAALALTLDLVAVDRAGGVDLLQLRISEVLAVSACAQAPAGREVVIPTQYGGADGPDLDAVARRVGLSSAEVVELHSAASYQVAMIGFQPGFPYLLGLPEQLQLPRRDSVRAQVAAGSVAIAGAQAGIYPSPSPGGWHLLGRTALTLFDPGAAAPSLLLPGDRVRFVPVR